MENGEVNINFGEISESSITVTPEEIKYDVLHFWRGKRLGSQVGGTIIHRLTNEFVPDAFIAYQAELDIAQGDPGQIVNARNRLISQLPLSSERWDQLISLSERLTTERDQNVVVEETLRFVKAVALDLKKTE